MINYDTKCPLTPCPSQTPNKCLPCFIKFSIIIYESWLVLFFFSGQYPTLLQKAIFVMMSYYFLPFPYFVSKSDHYFGFTFMLYCDFVFLCFKGFFYLIYLGCLMIDSLWGRLFKQLIVFLCTFFFLRSLLALF